MPFLKMYIMQSCFYVYFVIASHAAVKLYIFNKRILFY